MEKETHQCDPHLGALHHELLLRLTLVPVEQTLSREQCCATNTSLPLLATYWGEVPPLDVPRL